MNKTVSLQLILNADDFGLTEEYNNIVLKSFETGVISSATLMANMPFFSQACELAHKHGLTDRLGLHFNLTYGRPLSDSIRDQRTFCNEAGDFELCLPRHVFNLPSRAGTAVRAELESQWQACLEQGVRPTHIDSHQHVHNILPIARIVADFAGEQRVPVRLARNLGGNISWPKKLFKWLINSAIRKSAKTTDFACTPKDVMDGLLPQGAVEIVCHPLILENGEIGDDYLPATVSLEDVIKSAYPNAQRVSYSALK